jgi:hypothetical protein
MGDTACFWLNEIQSSDLRLNSQIEKSENGTKVSNSHSPANLSNLSTRQNGHFGKLAGLDTFADIRQPVLVGLDTFVDIRQTILLGLARLAKGKFGDFYTNLANLANLASVD